MSSDHQRITWRRNIVENFNRLSRVHERYRQTTDGQTDGRRHIANMNMSSRSLKSKESEFIQRFVMPISKALRYGPCVTRGSHSFTCHSHTNDTFTPQPQGVTTLWLVLIVPTH